MAQGSPEPTARSTGKAVAGDLGKLEGFSARVERQDWPVFCKGSRPDPGSAMEASKNNDATSDLRWGKKEKRKPVVTSNSSSSSDMGKGCRSCIRHVRCQGRRAADKALNSSADSTSGLAYLGASFAAFPYFMLDCLRANNSCPLNIPRLLRVLTQYPLLNPDGCSFSRVCRC